jgi:hypothetical protein
MSEVVAVPNEYAFAKQLGIRTEQLLYANTLIKINDFVSERVLRDCDVKLAYSLRFFCSSLKIPDEIYQTLRWDSSFWNNGTVDRLETVRLFEEVAKNIDSYVKQLGGKAGASRDVYRAFMEGRDLALLVMFTSKADAQAFRDFRLFQPCQIMMHDEIDARYESLGKRLGIDVSYKSGCLEADNYFWGLLEAYVEKCFEQPIPDATVTMPQSGRAESTPTESAVQPLSDDTQPKSDEVWHDDNFTIVEWFGVRYTFSATRAACIEVLWDGWEKGKPMRESDVLEKAGSDSKYLRYVFKGHPAWNTMIVVKNGICNLVKPSQPTNPCETGAK